MSVYHCEKCGHDSAIFGEGGAEKLIAEYNVPLLGKIPLELKIREQADVGKPIVISEPESNIAKIYSDIATMLTV